MKAKFYSICSFFTFLLLLVFAGAVQAQDITLAVENWSTGGDGTTGSGGDRLIYTIQVTGPQTMINPKVSCPTPLGTKYIPGTTTLNGQPFLPGSTTFPWATPQLIPVPLPPSNVVVIKFEVNITANSGNITGVATLETVNYPTVSTAQIVTNLRVESACSYFFSLTTSLPTGSHPLQPGTYYPYRYIRQLNVATGNASTIAHDGTTGLGINANGGSALPNGSVLTDATAMAFDNFPGRLYFVNKPVNNQPADLCYFIPFSAGPIANTAYQYVGSPLTTNVTSPITRMTLDANSQGYAITDDGQEFIHFWIEAIYPYSDIIHKDNPVPLVNDPANGSYSVLAETGGDIVADGSGKLLLIPNSGNVYRIDPSSKVATYLGTIPGFPAAGCRSVTIDNSGNIYIGGFYRQFYKFQLSTWTLTTVTSTSYATSDFAGCAVPLQPARVSTNDNTIRNETGAVQLSNEVSAKVLPNPFRSELTMQVQLNTAEHVKVRLMDFYGRTVYTTTEKLSAGVNSLRLPVPAGLGAGVYVVELWAGNSRLLQKKLIKQ